MGNWKFQFNIILLILGMSGCGELTTQTQLPAPTASEETPQEYAVILGANFTDPVGTLNLVPTTAPRTPSSNLQTTHSDAVVRSFAGRLYVVNRKGADNIQVVDPSDFSTLTQFSTGNGTNPQEIIAVSPTKAYVSLYEPEENQSAVLVDDLIIFDPTTGTISKTIDLTPYTFDDGDRYPRAAAMVLVGTDLFVAVQDMPSNLALPPDQSGKLVRINTQNDQIEALAILAGRDPFTMAYSATTQRLYVGCSDFFDLESPYGGVEVVNPTTMRSEGILLDDLLLGGSIGDLDVSGSAGYVVVAPIDFSENRVVRFSLDEAAPALATLYTSSGYLQEIAIDPSGQLWLGDRDPATNGMMLLHPETGELIEGPIAVGASPASITFVER